MPGENPDSWAIPSPPRGRKKFGQHFLRDAGTLDRVPQGMRHERRRLGCVECALVGAPDRRARRGDDHRFLHTNHLRGPRSVVWKGQTPPKILRHGCRYNHSETSFRFSASYRKNPLSDTLNGAYKSPRRVHRLGRILSPEVVDQPGGGHCFALSQQEHREHRPLQAASKCEWPCVSAGLQRPEDRELQHRRPYPRSVSGCYPSAQTATSAVRPLPTARWDRGDVYLEVL